MKLDCPDCGCPAERCEPLWPEQRKCCPDCKHPPAPAGRRMTLDERFAELWELGRHIWEQLPAEQRDRHQIDRQRLTRGAQCVCTCGAECPTWVFHLIEVRDYAELWARLEAHAMPRRFMLGMGVADPHEVGACCGHEYRRHLVGLDGCAVCEHHELKAARCAGWRRQLPESTT